MRSFFANLNFARVTILIALVASGALAYAGLDMRARRVELQDALVVDVKRSSQELQKKSRKLSMLTREATGKRGEVVEDPRSYISGLAGTTGIDLGDVEIRKGERSPERGITDVTYTIRSTDQNRGDRRPNISNFMFKLEQESGLMKVTNIHLEPAQKKLKPEDVPNDYWVYVIEATVRQKNEIQAGG